MAAQFFSSLADNALLVAAIAVLMQADAPSWLTPYLKFFFVASYVVLAPYVGAFADRLPKGQVMFLANSVKIVGCVLMLWGINPLASYAVVGLGAAAYSPAKYGILTEYLPHVEHLYQASDAYVFPVTSTDNAIEVPLSVLEALACDVPVVSTRFGGLPRLFGERQHPAVTFVDSPRALVEAAIAVSWSPPRGGRALVLDYAWERVAASLVDQTVVAMAARRSAN